MILQNERNDVSSLIRDRESRPLFCPTLQLAATLQAPRRAAGAGARLTRHLPEASAPSSVCCLLLRELGARPPRALRGLPPWLG